MRPFTVVFGKTSITSFEDFELSLFSNWKIQMNARNRQKPICWKHLDGWIFFSFIEVDWKCINCPLQRTVLQSHLRFNEFSWCGALAKRQKKLPETGKKRKITWRIRKKRSKSVSIFTQKLFVNKCPTRPRHLISRFGYDEVWNLNLVRFLDLLFFQLIKTLI